MRIKAALIAGLLALGILGISASQAQEVTVCYEYHVNIADTVVQDSGPDGEPVCTTLPPP